MLWDILQQTLLWPHIHGTLIAISVGFVTVFIISAPADHPVPGLNWISVCGHQLNLHQSFVSQQFIHCMKRVVKAWTINNA